MKLTSVNVVNRYIQPTQAKKAKKLIEKNLWKYLDKFLKEIEKEGVPTEKTNKALFMANTNASLWYAQVQGDDFFDLAKRFATGTKINQEVVTNLRKAYTRWLKSPSTLT